MKNSFTKIVAAFAAALVASSAHAAAGNGIRLGGSDARLHPFLDLETRYDSNVGYTTANKEVSDLILHVRPGLELKAPGDTAAVEFSGALDWAQYMGLDQSKTADDLSKLYASAGLAAVFNRQGAVAPRVENAFARQISATSLTAVGTPVISNMNLLSVAVPFRPGGGAMLVTANGQWLLESFGKYKDELPGNTLSDLGYSQFRGGAEMQYRFLPRTTALLSAGYFQRVPNKSETRPDDANGFDALAGITGLLTPRISATAKVGYGSTSAKDPQNIKNAKDVGTVLADVNAEYLPLDTVSVRVGYTRSLGLDPMAATYVADGVNGAVRVKLADRIAGRIGARWDKLVFEALDKNADTSYLRIDPGVEAKFGEWLSAAVGYVYTSRTVTWPKAFGVTPPDFAKNEAYLRVGVTY